MSFQLFIEEYVKLLERARRIPLGDYLTPRWPKDSAGTTITFSPHPDDEVLGAGPLAVSLRSEGFRVYNVAMTLGSDPKEFKRRQTELEAACEHLGFINVLLAEHGFGAIDNTRLDVNWSRALITIKRFIKEKNPDIIIAPHENDWHPRHRATAFMVRTAIERAKWNGLLFETEFWFQMEAPNFMLEVAPKRLAVMLEALSYHKGELARNPYHLRLHSQLCDNVRRAEVVLGKRAHAPDWTFAALYRRNVCTDGRIEPTKPERQTVSADECLLPNIWR